MTVRIGLIGLGAIGGGILRAVQDGTAGNTTISAVLVRDPYKHLSATASSLFAVTADPGRFFASEIDLVVEAAGHEAVRRYAVRSLVSGRDFLTISAGAFADDQLLAQVREAALSSGKRVLIPSGAIGGLDAIASAALGGLDEVTITTRKHPRAWKGTPAEQVVDLDRVTEPVCLYSGPAREAARLYPQNVNVQAALALAGIGMDRTQSRVFADPGVENNTHEIVARGHFGDIRVNIANVPSDANPKTGRLAILSMLKSIRSLTAPIVVGL